MIFQEGVGIQCSLTMIDLILDNRAIVDCMREKDINLIVKLLSQIKVNITNLTKHNIFYQNVLVTIGTKFYNHVCQLIIVNVIVCSTILFLIYCLLCASVTVLP